MKPIARLAIQRLKNLSHTARAIAAIRENGELEFYNLLGTEPEANDFYTKLCDILNIKTKTPLISEHKMSWQRSKRRELVQKNFGTKF